MNVAFSIPEAIAYTTFASLLIWAPIFGLAYARRRFGGAWQNYLAAYLSVSTLTAAAFALLAIIEHARR